MSTQLTFRIKAPDKIFELQCSSEESLKFLRSLISDRLGVHENSFEILWGYPLKKANYCPTVTIGSFLSNNEILRIQSLSNQGVEEISVPNTVATTSSLLACPATERRKKTEMTQKSILQVKGSKRTRVTRVEAQNEEDISELLLSAVSGGGGKKNKFLR